MNVRNFAPDEDVIIIETVGGDIKVERLEDGTIQVFTRQPGRGMRSLYHGWKQQTFLYPKTHK